jgi:UDP-N-acetylmuramyl tripeptide synthase
LDKEFLPSEGLALAAAEPASSYGAEVGSWERRATAAAAAVARLAGAASRGLGREGHAITGRVFLALAPPGGAQALARRGRSALVSGTNGKTTTTALIARALGEDVAVNATGANLMGGLHSALIERPHATTAVLEVDEAALPAALALVRPNVVALLNLSRDQLDRMHEVRRLAELWRAALDTYDGVVVANADDPLVTWAVRSCADVRWVGAGQPWLADATACPACRAAIVVADGMWRCSRCSLRRPVTGAGPVVPPTGLPGRCNEANAAMALVVVEELGGQVDPGAWAAMESVAGRYGRGVLDGREFRLLLAKNPAGWRETMPVLVPGRPLVVALNARVEDGTDPSWIWDVPFEQLAGARLICAGERAADLAVRLDYAGIEVEIEPDVGEAVARLPRGPVDVVANYSAFRTARSRLLARG